MFALELTEKSSCLSKCNIVNLEEEILRGSMPLTFGKLRVSTSVARLIIHLKFMIPHPYVFKVANRVSYELKNDCNSQHYSS